MTDHRIGLTIHRLQEVLDGDLDEIVNALDRPPPGREAQGTTARCSLTAGQVVGSGQMSTPPGRSTLLPVLVCGARTRLAEHCPIRHRSPAGGDRSPPRRRRPDPRSTDAERPPAPRPRLGPGERRGGRRGRGRGAGREARFRTLVDERASRTPAPAPDRPAGLLAARVRGHARRAHPPARDGAARRDGARAPARGAAAVDRRRGHRHRLHRSLARRGAARTPKSRAIDISPEPRSRWPRGIAHASGSRRRVRLRPGRPARARRRAGRARRPRRQQPPLRRRKATRASSPEVRDHEPAVALFAPGDALRRLSAPDRRRLSTLLRPGGCLAPGGRTRHGGAGEATLRSGRLRRAEVIADLQGIPDRGRSTARLGLMQSCGTRSGTSRPPPTCPRSRRIDCSPMDKIRVVGGRPLEGTVRISGAKNASLPDALRRAPDRRARASSRNVPEVRDIRTMGRVLAALGADVEFRVGGTVEIARSDAHLGRGPLRPRQDHAGLRARPRPAPGPRGPRPGLAARRLRDRRPAHQPAPRGPREDGRRDRGGARLRRGARRAAARGRDLLRHRRP